MAKKNRSLYHFLLATKAELLIRKRKEDTRVFREEVAVSNVIYAINEALKRIESRAKGEN